MAQMKRTLIALLVLAEAAGCKRTPPPPPAVTLDAPTDEGRARALAGRDPGASRPVDEAIRRAQGMLKKNDAAANWTALGELWVRKARESADPVYYASADASAQVALQLDPTLSIARSLRGLVLVSQHRFVEARAVAQETLA